MNEHQVARERLLKTLKSPEKEIFIRTGAVWAKAIHGIEPAAVVCYPKEQWSIDVYIVCKGNFPGRFVRSAVCIEGGNDGWYLIPAYDKAVAIYLSTSLPWFFSQSPGTHACACVARPSHLVDTIASTSSGILGIPPHIVEYLEWRGKDDGVSPTYDETES